MEYFRRFLIELRARENKAVADSKIKVSIILIIASVLGILLGVLMDFLLPNGYFTNMFRGVIAVPTGIAMFSLSYLLAVKNTSKKVQLDRYYKPIRQRFSYRQRVNFSIATGVIVASFVLLSGNGGLLFTLKAIIATFVIATLIAFSRRSRSEFIKDIYEIPDIRDLETSRDRKIISDRRNKESEKKRDKKSKKGKK